MTSYTCKKCKKRFFVRTDFLLHTSVCNTFLCLREEDISDSDSDKLIDDTDEDPDWEPEVTEMYSSPQSSPVTQEQEDMAWKVEEMLIPISSAEIRNGHTQDAQEQNDVGQDVGPNKEELKEKLKTVKERIALFKERRKEAFKTRKKSLAKRLSKNIKKFELLLSGLPSSIDLQMQASDENSNPTTLDDNYCNESANANIPTTKNKKYTRPRKLNFCIYCDDLVSKFAEHLQKKHKDKPEAKQLSEIKGSAVQKRIKKTEITDPIRKLWNSVYNKKNPNILAIPVKRSHGNNPTNSITCEYCLGYYRRDKLSVHLHNCASYAMAKAKVDTADGPCLTSISEKQPSKAKQSIPAIKQHSLPHIPDSCLTQVTPQFVEEILKGINIDEISLQAIHDATLMKFGSDFHISRRESASKSYVIRVVRDLAKIKMLMKKRNSSIETFEDCFNPSHFDILIESALEMAGYEKKTGFTKTPSVAYRLSPYLREAAEMIRTDRLADYYRDGKNDRRGIEEIDDFLKSIQHEWKKKIGRISIKSQKIARVDREEKIALEDDIVKLAAYIESKYRNVISLLTLAQDKNPHYDLLMHMLVTHIMLLIRRRPVDFKNAKVRHFDNIDKHDELLGMAGGKELKEVDLDVCKKFHLFYVPGKNLNIVPMVLTPLMKKVMHSLITERENVGINSDTLFVLSEDKPIKPDQSIRLMCTKVNLKKPSHLTGNGLRHQAATFSRLHSSHPQYQDYLASVLGHNLYTHRKHYELPLSITQKLMVCPILHNIMKGNVNDKNKQTEETNIEVEEREQNSNMEIAPATGDSPDIEMYPASVGSTEVETPVQRKEKTKWSTTEQNIVLGHFGEHIINKMKIKRGAVVQFMNEHGHLLNNRTIAQVYIFVCNQVGRKQFNVTPRVKRALKFQSL